ncbi:hypothetical protein BKA67DRAFT_37286 [Truncatella angustata]|uniref:Uncharacterized protein n=1 Tax=Truncatella angustata TaxID=152316 RepID=A0A9P8UXK9_9PEZI|nr:uncharacterized protein BKA67DRAFT_37286 [Truncatella angustata]KAH6660038.1 hypothetical protein BKA67DRAFT_37286 [Truncatella angustata]
MLTESQDENLVTCAQITGFVFPTTLIVFPTATTSIAANTATFALSTTTPGGVVPFLAEGLQPSSTLTMNSPSLSTVEGVPTLFTVDNETAVPSTTVDSPAVVTTLDNFDTAGPKQSLVLSTTTSPVVQVAMATLKASTALRSVALTWMVGFVFAL